MSRVDDYQMLEQSFWFFSNVFGENQLVRDHLLFKLNVVDYFHQVLNQEHLPIQIVSLIAWSMSNILRSAGLDDKYVCQFNSQCRCRKFSKS